MVTVCTVDCVDGAATSVDCATGVAGCVVAADGMDRRHDYNWVKQICIACNINFKLVSFVYTAKIKQSVLKIEHHHWSRRGVFMKKLYFLSFIP